MRPVVLGIVVAVGCFALGWMAGRAAQTPQADFEIEVSNPNGPATITCVRGCALQFIRDVPNKAEAQRTFKYEGAGASVHGWRLP
jgi:hypothetical protein